MCFKLALLLVDSAVAALLGLASERPDCSTSVQEHDASLSSLPSPASTSTSSTAADHPALAPGALTVVQRITLAETQLQTACSWLVAASSLTGPRLGRDALICRSDARHKLVRLSQALDITLRGWAKHICTSDAELGLSLEESLNTIRASPSAEGAPAHLHVLALARLLVTHHKCLRESYGRC